MMQATGAPLCIILVHAHQSHKFTQLSYNLCQHTESAYNNNIACQIDNQQLAAGSKRFKNIVGPACGRSSRQILYPVILVLSFSKEEWRQHHSNVYEDL